MSVPQLEEMNLTNSQSHYKVDYELTEDTDDDDRRYFAFSSAKLVRSESIRARREKEQINEIGDEGTKRILTCSP